MIKTALAASALILVGLPAAALAQDAPKGYAAFGYTRFDTDQATLGVLSGRAGWKLLPHAGLEAEAGIGVEDDTFEVSIGVTGGTIELEHDVAVYAVGFLPLGDHVELFARAGYGSTSLKASTPAVTVVGDGESFNYGAGASVFYRANGVRADWTRKDFTDNGGEADTWSLSYIRRF